MSDLRPWLRDEGAIIQAQRLLSHLEHWHDKAGNTYDLLNPEAQVQTIIDKLIEARASAVAWTHTATERGFALAEARERREGGNGE